MGENKTNPQSRKVAAMKEKITFALTRNKEIEDGVKQGILEKMSPIEQELLSAENSAWKTIARIVDIRLKIELGRADKAKAESKKARK